MSEPKLPPSLTLLGEATDRQIAAYMVELCAELRMAMNDPRSRSTERKKAILDLIETEARRIAEETDDMSG